MITLAGYLVQLQGGSWVKANATDLTEQGSMLGIALGAAPENGILIRGFFAAQLAYHYTGAESEGEPLYVHILDGTISNTPPTVATQYVRAIGLYGQDTFVV